MDSFLACKWRGCTSGGFKDADELYNHLTNDHVGRKAKKNLCLDCMWQGCNVKTFKRDHITSHLRVHIPLKPHTCKECGKSFKRPQDLKKHEKKHPEFRFQKYHGQYPSFTENKEPNASNKLNFSSFINYSIPTFKKQGEQPISLDRESSINRLFNSQVNSNASGPSIFLNRMLTRAPSIADMIKSNPRNNTFPNTNIKLHSKPRTEPPMLFRKTQTFNERLVYEKDQTFGIHDFFHKKPASLQSMNTVPKEISVLSSPSSFKTDDSDLPTEKVHPFEQSQKEKREDEIKANPDNFNVLNKNAETDGSPFKNIRGVFARSEDRPYNFKRAKTSAGHGEIKAQKTTKSPSPKLETSSDSNDSDNGYTRSTGSANLNCHSSFKNPAFSLNRLESLHLASPKLTAGSLSPMASPTKAAKGSPSKSTTETKPQLTSQLNKSKISLPPISALTQYIENSSHAQNNPKSLQKARTFRF